MTFGSGTYENFLSVHSDTQWRLFPQYRGHRTDFDIVIIGSGFGGGVLADDLVDRLGEQKRVLVIEAGSYVFPTHVYNICRFPNAEVARHFACGTFWQRGHENDRTYIHERPQLNFGGRSIFWSGLIPTVQPWELEFFPQAVRMALSGGLLDEAGHRMNESVTMGATAKAIVDHLQTTPLADHFDIRETPRALHQPYLTAGGDPAAGFHVEPTGVFNTAELLINQAGLSPGVYHGDRGGLHIMLNTYVEDVLPAAGDRFELIVRNTLDGGARTLQAGTVVLAGGSIESPKLLKRSTIMRSLPPEVQARVGQGLTDHPTTDWIAAEVDAVGPVPIPKTAHAKIVFYSKGNRGADGAILHPFNVEMNINHEYWHLRDNDPSAAPAPPAAGAASLAEIKFSFGNALDLDNAVKDAGPFQYVPEIEFKNLKWMDDLAHARFPALAGWNKDFDGIFQVLNGVADRIFSEFSHNGGAVRPDGALGRNGKGFGAGTVHHAAGTLRMPYRPRHGDQISQDSVVDEDLRVQGTRHLYVCDMAVMPFSAAANPVRTLVALALRLSRHFG